MIPVSLESLDFFKDTRVLSFLTGLKDLDLPRPMITDKNLSDKFLRMKSVYETAPAAIQIMAADTVISFEQGSDFRVSY